MAEQSGETWVVCMTFNLDMRLEGMSLHGIGKQS
jgi:hypothetical protein